MRTPGVARIIAAQLLARFPSGMLSLAILLHVERVHDSYGAAGLVLAATSIGQGIAGPLTSRWMGRWGMRPVLLLTITVCAAAVTTIALVEMPVVLYMLVALIAGLSYPPVQPAVRTIYPKMVTSRQLTPLFSLDASAQELIWIGGPVIATFVSTQISTVLGILLAVIFLLAGGVWFVASPEVGRIRIPRTKRSFGTVMKRPPVLLVTAVGFLMIAAAAAVEAGVVATFGHGGPEAGFVLAIWALGSLASGLALGHLPVSQWSLPRRTGMLFVGLALATFSQDFWWMTISLLVSSIGFAPALAVMFATVSASVRFSDTAEAYGWVGTGQLIGAAVGSALAGFLIDSAGPVGAFWTGGAFAAACVLVATLFRRASPDLRGREAGPIADTEPVALPPT
ncbi:MFS transporter [Lysobacter korlensis]|uniref:MFS transporter n=1 Tax=Lysobacter korlensis TaxID=553636 RepID=A0ABV6RW46_9GAMM